MSKTNNIKAIETWSIYNAYALTICSVLTLAFKQLLFLFIAFSPSLLILLYINRQSLLNSKPVFGIANTLTLIRYIIIALSFCFIEVSDKQLLFYVLLVAVILDFFDGKAARYFNETSFFGQYFDMEIDAFYVLLMCCFYFLHDGYTWWILIPGLLRYLYRIYTVLVPKPNFKERKKIYATIIAATYFVILLLGLIVAQPYQYIMLLLGSIAIMASFTVALIEYHKS